MAGWGWGLEFVQSLCGDPQAERTQDTIRENSRSFTLQSLPLIPASPRSPGP